MTTATLETAPALDAANDADLHQPEPDASHHLEAQEPVLDQIAAVDAEFAFQNYGQRLPVAFSHGAGVEIWDFAGKRYLDFLGGIAVTQVGHAHPRVVEAIAKQAASVMHVSNYFYIAPQVELAKRLSALSYGFRAFFCNSGAEANEAALKLTRKFHHDAGNHDKIEVVTVWKSFHGRTLGVLGATGNENYHKGFAPLPSGHVLVALNDVAALEAAFSEHTAAFMLEPILGESGILMPSPEFVSKARELCDKFGALLIFDEVQAGNGRSGKFWAHEWFEITPDIITTAKGLANGVPIGAMLAREEIAAHLTPGSHGTTFGGNFLASAAANATLGVIEDENLMENAANVGAYFMAKLREWGDQSGAVKEVRGRGLMVGCELNSPHARELMKQSLENGLILNAVGDSILRFLPPLVVSKSQVDEAMAILGRSWEKSNEKFDN